MNIEQLCRSIRIVLMETSHPGNIGSAARAMKTMGLSELYLVSPQVLPNSQTKAMASGADDLISNAKIFCSLNEAIDDCQLVVGVSARVRGISLPIKTSEQAAQLWLDYAKDQQPVALLFGREDRGLTNEELCRCHHQVYIASNPDFSSLNLAAAVQVICYEIRKRFLAETDVMSDATTFEVMKKGCPKVQAGTMEHFFSHLEETLKAISFFKGSANSDTIMIKLRRLYNRAELDEMELNILRGILAETQRMVQKYS